ncbi:MAG: hypothetical protein AAF358_08650 [Pseudomonadota bacterium]
MLVRLVIIVLAALALTGLGLFLSINQPETQDAAGPTVAESPGGEDPLAVDQTAEVERPKPAVGARLSRPARNDVEVEQPPDRAQAAVTLAERIVPESDLALNETKLAESWRMEDYLTATANPDTIDAATAFAAYEFARSCVGEPRSDEQFEFRLEQFSQYAENRPRRVSSQRLDRAMDRLQDDFLRCEDFADEDLVKTASDWLMLAADLDYLPALVRFYQELPGLLRETQARVFREPHYLDLHRAKSLEYLDRALLTGHPRAFLATAIALNDGVIFEEDELAAHAYLTAASLAAGGRDPQIEEMLERSGLTLGDSALITAERWGRNLCWEYCQLGE